MALLAAGCAADAGVDLQVGEWRVDNAMIEREAARRGVGRCEAAESLAEEELIRLEYCGRMKAHPACSASDRMAALAAAVEDAVRPTTAQDVAAVVSESRFLRELEPQEPTLSGKLAERRARRALLRERAQIARRGVSVRLPAGCERRRPRAAP